MTTSAQQPSAPAEPGITTDQGTQDGRSLAQRLAAAVHPTKPAQAGPTGPGHVAQAAADAARPELTGRLAKLRSFTAHTRIRMVATSGWLSVWLAGSTVTGMYLLSEPVFRTTERVAPLGYVLFGVVAGLIAWVAGAMLTQGDARPDRANPRSYTDLIARMRDAEAKIEPLADAGRLKESAAVEQLGELWARVRQIPPDPGWSTGMGYVNAWRDVHRVELAIVGVVDADEFDRILHHDELRIEGSKLERRESKIPALVADARKLLQGHAPKDARPLLLTIRETVNDFRDQRFEALVRNRMHIDRVSLLLGLAAWALLSLGILAGADRDTVTGVSAFYLIGVAIGLFTQLRSGASESLEDVFGYGQSQLRQTILVSGLAAVAGVFLTSFAGAAATQGVADPAGTVVKLSLLDALRFSPVTVVTAAAFGLAPGMLTDRLSGWAKANIKDLESTSGASSGQEGQG